LNRKAVLMRLARHILSLRIDHPIRVAIDGVDTAGKTTLADELGLLIRTQGRDVIRASIDGFHNPSAIRYMAGETPEGYFNDSFNYKELISTLLVPFGPNGRRKYVPAIFDYKTDRPRLVEERVADTDSILLFDGVFLLRKELSEYWDFTIFMEISFSTVLERAKQRDKVLFGTDEKVTRKYKERYIPGQELYLREEDPKNRAMVIIENEDPENPILCYNM
jgi:uridine kinase